MIDSMSISFHTAVFNLEPNFNEMKRNFISSKGKCDPIAERQEELDLFNSLDGEDSEEEHPEKPKKSKTDQYDWSEGSLDEYEDLMSVVCSEEVSQDGYYELISDEVIYSSSFNIIRNVVKYKKYTKIKKESIKRNAF